MNDLRVLNAVPNKEKGRGRERGKREKKRKREVTAVIRKFPVDLYMGVHDDSTPHNRLHTKSAVSGNISNHLAPVVQTLNSAIHRINHYPADKYYGNQLRYPLDSDLSGR